MTVVSFDQLGSFIYANRRHTNERQSDLAEDIEVSTLAVGNWERSDAIPTLSNIIKLAKHFNYDVHFVFAEKGEIDELCADDLSEVLH